MRNQFLSRPDVQMYLAKYPDVTKKEKKELLNWLRQGNSPYSKTTAMFSMNLIVPLISLLRYAQKTNGMRKNGASV